MIVECTHCREHVQATMHGRFEKLSDGGGPSHMFSMLSCDQCKNPILIRQANVGNMAEGDKWDTPFLSELGRKSKSQRSPRNTICVGGGVRLLSCPGLPGLSD